MRWEPNAEGTTFCRTQRNPARTELTLHPEASFTEPQGAIYATMGEKSPQSFLALNPLCYNLTFQASMFWGNVLLYNWI